MQTYNSSRAQNDNYRVIITCAGVEIIADIPEEFSTAVGSEWENRLPSTLPSLLEGFAKAVAGSSAQIQAATQQVWVNSSPIELPVSLIFDAIEDPFREVVEPIRLLESWAMPEIAAGFLHAPGPPIWGSSRDYGCSVRVGRQFWLPDMVLISAQSTMSTRLDAKGDPIAGRIDCTFRSSRVLSRDEWLRATVGFRPNERGYSSGGGSGGGGGGGF